MKTISSIVLLAFLAACAGTPAVEGTKEKETLLAQYKQQVHELEQKIGTLEKELQEGKEVEYVNVKVTEMQPQLFEHFIDVTGNVEADQEVDVSAEGAGKILEILVREGQKVEKGQALAILNTEILDRSIEEVKISLDLATTTFERQKNLWEQKIGSEMQYLQAKSNKESLERRLESLQAQKDMTMVKSPVSGVVDVIYQKKGEIAGPQIPFAKVVNIDKVKIYAEVSESYLTKLKQGDEVLVDFPALGKQVKASINLIGNYINPDNRTFRVRINLDNRDNMIKPNLLSVVKIRDYVAKDAFVVPSLLVKQDFKGEYTFISENQQARKVYVKTGVNNNNMVEVLEGLKAGDLIISEGFNQVVSGTHIRF
ncbi:MAG: efflux RND transporter periplasmic adaptor subunit [Prolixibacteraceae bacterium]|nr:efflux RND transporter periplasmic adaptor subunit [Prolixibacteraceae bacterium]